MGGTIGRSMGAASVAGWLVACGSGPQAGQPDPGTTSAGATTTRGPAGTTAADSTGGATGTTTGGRDCLPQSYCIDAQTRRSQECGADAWADEACADGSGCVQGECVVGQCSDECTFGEIDRGGRQCELYDIGSDAWVELDPTGSMHDRSRAYTQWLRRDMLPFGGIASARYADPPTYAQLEAWTDAGDSAIWTGTYLAAEALRLKTTGSAEARRNVIELVQTLHRWWNIPAGAGMLARYARPSANAGDALNVDAVAPCQARQVHCDIDYEGEAWDYSGRTSRDQYQGVLLGYALAYEALTTDDEATRQLIRDDLVEFVDELMTERTLTVRIIEAEGITEVEVTTRFVVLAEDEMVDGAVEIDMQGADPQLWGFQEFHPRLGQLLSQLPGYETYGFVTRADSAVMLSSIFRLGLLVTDGVEGSEAKYQAFRDFYYEYDGPEGNAYSWRALAAAWTYLGSCGLTYYANNILMQPMYNVVRLEDDPALHASWVNAVMVERVWPTFASTKNVFFSGIYAANVDDADPAVMESALQQLQGFPPPPRVHVTTDLLDDPQYQPFEPGCENQTAHEGAVDVADRAVTDFLWQRNPWWVWDQGNLAQVYPGVDYLVALWLAGAHGFYEDDRPGTCTSWRAP